MAKQLDAESKWISTKRFHWDPMTRTFACELSDLATGLLPYVVASGFHQIYPDAADVGLAIRSERTGKVAWFFLAEEHTHYPDREITHWTLKPTAEAIKADPALDGVKVILFND